MSFVNVKTMLSAAAAIAVLGLSQANAGVVTFNVANDDATSGISAAKTYTAKNTMGTNPVTVNGVTFDGVVTSGATVTAPGSVSTATGPNLNEWKTDAEVIGFISSSNVLPGDFRSLLFPFRYTPGSVALQEHTLLGLVAGQTYDLRVYGRSWLTGDSRNVTLNFTGDGSTTPYAFNEDGTADGWYVSHVYTYDGVSTPGFTATNNFHSYGFSNEVVVPEPTTLGLLGLGGLLLGRRRRA